MNQKRLFIYKMVYFPQNTEPLCICPHQKWHNLLKKINLSNSHYWFLLNYTQMLTAVECKERNPPVRWDRAAPDQWCPEDIPEAPGSAAAALCTLLGGEPRSRHWDEPLNSAARGQRQPARHVSSGGLLPVYAPLVLMIRMCGKAPIDLCLSRVQGSVEV